MASILLIEDDEPLRQILALALVNAGHTVAEAADGNQGIERFREAPPDLVITDIVMPGREGIETIMALRREAPRLPIIAISGAANYARVYLGMAAKLGAQRILSKPFNTADLLAAINEVLSTPPAG
jgi:DNA-binding response OmpR family regulator